MTLNCCKTLCVCIHNSYLPKAQALMNDMTQNKYIFPLFHPPFIETPPVKKEDSLQESPDDGMGDSIARGSSTTSTNDRLILPIDY